MAKPRTKASRPSPSTPRPTELESVTLRLAGDSGDGIQLAGMQFTRTSALQGNAVSVLSDYPAEIRAPAGSLAGVSGFQVQISSTPIHTPGDRIHTLVAMNPAALRVNLPDLAPEGILLVDEETFDEERLRNAGYTSNPLTDGSLRDYRVLAVPMTSLNRNALCKIQDESAVFFTPRGADRCKNFFMLGLLYWLFQRARESTHKWIETTFPQNIEIREANKLALDTGYRFGRSTLTECFHIGPAPIEEGRYRKVTGIEALAIGMVAASVVAKKPLLFATAPNPTITDLLQQMAERINFKGVRVLQAENEVAAMGAILGAAFGGTLGVTATSGPGLGLKAEAMGLAVMTELPVVVIDLQRAGPSTGMPTKTEQSDLLQALHGRHGESPVVVLAPSSPADCFETMLEAIRLAVGYMTPVVLLADSSLANGAEPWRVPDRKDLSPIQVHHAEVNGTATPFHPYQRDARLVRPWAVPGTPGKEHRIGGLEKETETGNVSYDPTNHEEMVRTRKQKIANIASALPLLEVEGPAKGELLVLGWGATYGSIHAAIQQCKRAKLAVAHAHLRYLNPLPRNLGDILRRYRRVLIPELNDGQLRSVIRAEYLVDAMGLNKMQGRPFLVSEIYERITQMMEKRSRKRE